MKGIILTEFMDQVAEEVGWTSRGRRGMWHTW